MTLTDMKIPFTVDASGDAVVYGERSVFARLIAVFYDRGDMATGTDFILTTDQYDVVEAIVQGGADGADLTGTSGGDREPYLMIGRPKLTVDEGGATTSGAFILILEE